MNVRIRPLLITSLLLGFTADGAWASMAVRIQLSLQNMTVTVDGTEFATWPVSTARKGYRTPVGIYHPINWSGCIIPNSTITLRCLIRSFFTPDTPFTAPLKSAIWAARCPTAASGSARTMRDHYSSWFKARDCKTRRSRSSSSARIAPIDTPSVNAVSVSWRDQDRL